LGTTGVEATASLAPSGESVPQSTCTTTHRSAQIMKNTPQKHSAKKQNKHMSLRTLRGKGVYCGVQVHMSQPRDQPNTVARILILTCQIVVGSMTGGAAQASNIFEEVWILVTS